MLEFSHCNFILALIAFDANKERDLLSYSLFNKIVHLSIVRRVSAEIKCTQIGVSAVAGQ